MRCVYGPALKTSGIAAILSSDGALNELLVLDSMHSTLLCSAACLQDQMDAQAHVDHRPTGADPVLLGDRLRIHVRSVTTVMHTSPETHGSVSSIGSFLHTEAR